MTQASRELRTIPGVRNFGSHIGQAFLAEEIAGVELRRELGQRRPRGRLRQDARVDRGGGRRLSRALPRRADLPARAHRRGAGGRRGADRRAHLRRGPRRRCSSQADAGRRSAVGHRRAWTTCTSSSWPTCRRSRSARTSPRRERYGLKPGDVRRAAARARVQRGGRRHLPRRTRLRRARLEHAEHAQQPRPTSATCRSTPRRAATCASATWPRSACARRRTSIHRQDASRRIDVAANVERTAASATSWRRRPRPARGARRSRPATTPSCSARRWSSEGAQNRLLVFGLGGRARRSSCSCRRRSGACAWRCCSS